VQRRSVDIWKENILDDLEEEYWKFKLVKEFLAELKEFGERDDKSAKIVELKMMKQGSRTMEEFVQEFKRTIRESEYKG